MPDVTQSQEQKWKIPIMASLREQILSALFNALMAIPVKILRNEALPEKVPAGGLMILRDGDAGEPETVLSPLSYYWNHTATLEVIVQHADAARRDALMDALFQKIGAVLATDQTLGELCDRVTPLSPDTSSLAIEGAASVKAAIIPIELIYITDSPLG